VLLVADASAMARSAAAVVQGFEDFDRALDVAGVLFNRVGSVGHGELLREAVASWCRAAAVGFLPFDDGIALPSRHLGLEMAAESLSQECLEQMAAWVVGNVDLEALLKLARERARPLAAWTSQEANPTVSIGIARDAAFCFYYRDNLDLLRAAGAELIEFSPTVDTALPPGVKGLYLGGGYPELHAAALSANRPMLDAVRQFDGPIYAECGGFMYLTLAIVDAAGAAYPMAGLFPTCARMQPRLAALGYLEAEAPADVLWLRAGERVRGHEFRHSEIDPMPPEVRRCLLLRNGRRERAEGYRTGLVLAGYAHLHFGSAPEFAGRFVEACRNR
jgi:cobyrinic acid a,c-diamide synthase